MLRLEAVVIIFHIFQPLPSRHVAALHFLAPLSGAVGPVLANEL